MEAAVERLDVRTASQKDVLRHLRALRAGADPHAHWSHWLGAARHMRIALGRTEARVRVAALRTLRHLCAATRMAAWHAAWCEHVDLGLVACLDGKAQQPTRPTESNGRNANGRHASRDTHELLEQERLEALKLFALLAATEAGSLTGSLLSSVVAIAESGDDPMSGCAVEALRQLAATDVDVLCGHVTADDTPDSISALLRSQAAAEYHGEGLDALLGSLVLEDSSNAATPDNNVMALGTTIGFLLDGPNPCWQLIWSLRRPLRNSE